MSGAKLPNIHGTAVVLGRYGVLIIGVSGTGKTTLALELIKNAGGAGRFARLVADDQLFAETAGGVLIVHAPPMIEGLVEVHGLGPTGVPWISSAKIDCVCNLGSESPRFQEAGEREVAGVILPSLNFGARDTERSARAILAALELNYFADMRQNGRGRTKYPLVK